MSVLEFQKMKSEKQKISMVTCYDFWSAQIIESSDIDCVLVGDSLSMVMHGQPSTVYADIDTIALHTQCVARGLKTKFLIADMPFMTVQKGLKYALDCVEKLMKSGAHAVKIENIRGHEEIISAIIRSGVPVMGHLGLTPQSVNQFGGYKVQGRSHDAHDFLLNDASRYEELGCFAVVLECIPEKLGQEVTEKLKIPTIGIGAGPQTDGQVLVLQDLLGLTQSRKPKFLRTYLNGSEMIIQSLNQYDHDVKHHNFPNESESYQ